MRILSLFTHPQIVPNFYFWMKYPSNPHTNLDKSTLLYVKQNMICVSFQ